MNEKPVPGSIDAVARLLRAAGHRQLPPEALTQRVYARTRDRWLQQRQPRSRWQLALAAGVLLAVGVGSIALLRDRALVLATSETVQGDAALLTGGQRELLAAGTELRAGDQIATEARSAVVLRERTGIAIRLAPDSVVQWRQGMRLRILRGQAYVDLESASVPDSDLVLETDFGNIHHLGTRYLASVSDTGLVVGVRDGRVVVEHRIGRFEVARGERLSIDRRGDIVRSRLPTHGDFWAWADGLAPPVAIEGRSLHEILTQLARQTGLELRFSSAEVEQAARRLKLHGPALALTPVDAIAAVLSTTSMHASVDGDSLVVQSK